MRKKKTGIPGRSKLAQSRIDYITFGNPVAVGKMLNDYGYEAPESLPELPGAVRELIRLEGKKAVADLVKLHPDRGAILETVNLLPPATTVMTEHKKPEPENKKEATEGEKKNCRCESCAKRNRQEDSFCGCQHSYNSYNAFTQDTFDKISAMETAELLRQYDVLRRKATANPSNKNLADETMLVWNEIRQRSNRAPGQRDKIAQEYSSFLPATPAEKNKEENSKDKNIPLSRTEGLALFGITIALALIIGVMAVNTKYQYTRS
jgi:hypothetical protein